MKHSIFCVSLLALLSGCANTQTGLKPVANKDIPVVDYKYGMHLDIAKVISTTDISKEEGIVPVTIKYADSQGNIHKVRVLEDADDGTPKDE